MLQDCDVCIYIFIRMRRYLLTLDTIDILSLVYLIFFFFQIK